MQSSALECTSSNSQRHKWNYSCTIYLWLAMWKLVVVIHGLAGGGGDENRLRERETRREADV